MMFATTIDDIGRLQFLFFTYCYGSIVLVAFRIDEFGELVVLNMQTAVYYVSAIKTS